MVYCAACIDGIKNLNWYKFIVDELHKALLKRKPTRGCLLFYNLLYIHAIDLSGHGIVLPDGPFPINVWTKKLITLVLNKDVQADKVSFGKLPLKPELGMNFCLFGGLEGLDKFMRVHTVPSCSQEKFAKSTQIVARFTSAMVGILGNLVQSLTALDDEGHSDASRQLDAGLNVLSSAARTTARTTRSSQGRRPESPGKNVAEDSDSDDEYHGGNDAEFDADSDDDDDFNDMDYRVVRRRRNDPFVSSGSASVGSGDGGLSQQGLTDTQAEAATESSVKQCGSQLLKNLAYQRRKKLRLPSPPRSASPTVPSPPPPRPTSPAVPPGPSQRPSSPIALSAAEIHLAVKKVVVQELGIRVAEKGTGVAVPLSTMRKEAPRRAPGKQSVAAKDSEIAPVKSAPMKQVAAAKGSPSVSGKSRSKDKSAVKKVKFAKTRSSPRLRTTLSQTTSSETTEVIHLDESPTATSPSDKVAAASKGASDVVAATSAGVSGDPIDQLAAAATVTAVVEDIASAAEAVECENEVVPNIVHDEGEAVRVTEEVVGGTRVNMPIDTATAGGQENDAHNPAATVADPMLESSTPGAGEYDGNFTPPSCSLGLDVIFGASPQVPPSTEATPTTQAAPALAHVPPAAPQASAAAPSALVPPAAPEASAAAPSAQVPPVAPEAPAAAPLAQVPPAAPEAPAAAPSAQVPPAAPATGPVAVLGLASPVAAGSKGKTMVKVTNAQPVAWAPPPNSNNPQSPTFVTPELPRTEHLVRSSIPKSFIRKVRVTHPSKYLLRPFATLTPSEEEEFVYNEVIKHTTDSNSKIKDVRVIDIDGRWVTLGELANCVKGVGQLSTNIAELHETSPKFVLKYFRRDKFYILSHQDQLPPM
nr:proline-rich protein 36-like [Aegilops tauschii subsp. strangulata]